MGVHLKVVVNHVFTVVVYMDKQKREAAFICESCLSVFKVRMS